MDDVDSIVETYGSNGIEISAYNANGKEVIDLGWAEPIRPKRRKAAALPPSTPSQADKEALAQEARVRLLAKSSYTLK